MLYFAFSFLNAVFAGIVSAESHCLLIQSIVNIVPKKINNIILEAIFTDTMMVGFYFCEANDLIFACKIFLCWSDSDIIFFPFVQTEQNNVVLKG